MKKIIFSLLPLIFLGVEPPLFAQDIAPDDASTAMTVDAGEPITGNDPANKDDVPGDPNYVPPDSFQTGGNYEGPVGVTGIFNGNISTGCSYDPLGHSAHRVIDDIVVPGGLGKYPLKMTRYYNSRQQYYAGGAIALGPGWAHEYSWLVWANGTKIISPHGNVSDFYCGAPVGVSEGWEGNDWRLADGGRVHFDSSSGRCTYIQDPYGLRTTITYSGDRISRVTEPGGRYLQFSYGAASDPDGTLLLTRVEAHALGNATVTDSVDYSYTLVSAGVQGRNKMMLTGVSYSDGTLATYEYRIDNVTESPTTHKMYPLLQRADDVRSNGPMRTIRYEYQNAGPHGAIINEKYPGVGALTAISPGADVGDTFTETRGDGPTRSFTYTHMHHCHGSECGPCDDVQNSNPPQQMLTRYTDFQGHTTILGYDSNWYINSVRDANNHTTTYERGPPPPGGIGQITKITHHDNKYIQYTYENEGTGHISGHYVMSIRDERGSMIVHTRDSHHRITRTDYQDANGNILAYETFSYCDQADSQCNNTFGQLKRHRLKNGAYVHYQYDSRGRLTAKWNPTTNATAQAGDPKTIYEYWTNWVWADRVYKVTLPANVSNQVAFDRYEYDRNAAGTAKPGRGLVTKTTHADGTYQSAAYSQYGNKMWEENEKRQRTTYTYDNYNRVLSVKNPLNKTETYVYLKPGTSSAYLYTTGSVYTQTSRAGIVTTNVYDQNWRKSSSATAGATTSFDYDDVGNLTQVTDPRFKVTRHGYDTRNRKTSTTEAVGTNLARTTVWHYDGANNINQIDRPDGINETKGFDALNRMTWHRVPRQVPGASPAPTPTNVTTHFDYNPSGTIQQVTDPNGRHTTFDYDASDRRITMTYPGGSSYQAWTYDNAGNLASRRTVNNETQNFTYDKRNRKIGMSWSNGADSASFTYDDASRLLTATNPNSVVTRAYDAAGRLTQDLQNVTGLGSKNVTYPLYDDDGRLKQVSLAGVYDYTFAYDAMGRFEKILSGGSVKFQYAYDAASNERNRYAYLPNGVTIDQAYGRDSLNRMSSRWLKKNGDPFAVSVYTYDRMSRLGSIQRAEDGGKKDVFGYFWTGELRWVQYGVQNDAPIQEGTDPDLDTTDNVDPFANYRAPEITEPEPPPPPDDYTDLPQGGVGQTESGEFDRWVGYYLDRAGNRTSVGDTVNGNASYSPNNLNQYTSVAGSTVTNGPEHEISDFQGNHYSYINDEHLKQVNNGSNNYYLYYDALGRCVKRTLGSVTTYYVYDGEKPILDYKSNDLTHPAKNVYGKGIDEILMRADPTVSGNPFYYQQDHEGSVTHLLNASGNPIESYRYDVFGAPTFLDATGNPLNPNCTAYNNRFLFTGREYAATYQKTYVAAFNFYEYRARAYHPILGRFMSEDPKLFDAGDYNLFRYCHNDPMDLADPMGMDAEPNGDGTYHFVLRREVVVGNVIGANVVNKTDGTPRQCAGAGQFLTGTRTPDGVLHDAPRAGNGGWQQGAPLTKETPNGTLVARGWENGKYPNKGVDEYKKDEVINHTGIKVGWDDKKGAIILDQWQGQNGCLRTRTYNPNEGDWSVVNAKKRYDPQPTRSDLRFEQEIKKSAQEAEDISAQHLHSEDRRNR